MNLLFCFLFAKKYFFFNPFVGGFLTNKNKLGSWSHHFYSVTPQESYDIEKVKGKFLLKMRKGTLDRNRRSQRPIGWRIHRSSNQLFDLSNNKIKNGKFCLKGGLNAPYFAKCNGEEDETWIKVEEKIGKKINENIAQGIL